MILDVVYVVIILVLTYSTYNLYKKVDFLEGVLNSNYLVMQSIYSNMLKIDSSGNFKAEDEVGTIFDALLAEIKRLDNLIEDKNNAA